MVGDGSRADPQFTVLMPTHNRADVIAFAIRSVLAQTNRDFELFIVADGCTDDTARVVGGFDDPRIRFFDLPKAPFFGYANRNIALREARGRYIAFAAHDDLLFPDHLELLGELLDRSGTALAYSRPVWVSDEGTAIPLYTDITFPDALAEFREIGNSIPANAVVHRRDSLERVGYWPENVPDAADWVLWRRIIDADGGRVSHLPVATSLHFIANWRTSDASRFRAHSYGSAFAERCGWWPSLLRCAPSPGKTVQEAYSTVMEAGGLQWSATFRATLDKVVSRLSWMLMNEILPEMDRREKAMAALDAQRNELLATNLQLQQSTSWRITRPLRALRRLLPGGKGGDSR